MYGLRSQVDEDTVSNIVINESANRARSPSPNSLCDDSEGNVQPAARHQRRRSNSPVDRSGSSFDQFRDPPRVPSGSNKQRLQRRGSN